MLAMGTAHDGFSIRSDSRAQPCSELPVKKLDDSLLLLLDVLSYLLMSMLASGKRGRSFFRIKSSLAVGAMR